MLTSCIWHGRAAGRFDVICISGSHYSCYEDLPWINAMMEIIPRWVGATGVERIMEDHCLTVGRVPSLDMQCQSLTASNNVKLNRVEYNRLEGWTHCLHEWSYDGVNEAIST